MCSDKTHGGDKLLYIICIAKRPWHMAIKYHFDVAYANVSFVPPERAWERG